MANQQSHVSFSFVLALLYGLTGLLSFRLGAEYVLLAAMIVVLTGLLPNIDAGSEPPARELGGLLAAVSPLLLFEYYPSLKGGGVARVVLVVVCCYLLTRVVVVRFLQKCTTHRGMIHSIPAAIITFEATYLLFWDLNPKNRLFMAFAALLGYLSHLVLDAYGNFDLLGKAMGKSQKKPGALKLFAGSLAGSLVLYAVLFVLGWYVARDFYPRLQIHTKIVY